MKSKGPFSLRMSTIGHDIKDVTGERVCSLSAKLIKWNNEKQELEVIRTEQERIEEAQFVLEAMNDAWNYNEFLNGRDNLNIKIVGPEGDRPDFLKDLKSRCMDCKYIFKNQDEMCVTCSNKEPYLELCQTCYNKRGNTVR